MYAKRSNVCTASSVWSPCLRPVHTRQVIRCAAQGRKDQVSAVTCHEEKSKNALIPAMGMIAPLLVTDPALAIGREYGVLEGRIASLMHPGFMFFLLGASVYTGYLGFQWRRTRELAAEIKDLKSQKGASGTQEEGAEPVASPLDAQIKELETVRLAAYTFLGNDEDAMHVVLFCWWEQSRLSCSVFMYGNVSS